MKRVNSNNRLIQKLTKHSSVIYSALEIMDAYFCRNVQN